MTAQEAQQRLINGHNGGFTPTALDLDAKSVCAAVAAAFIKAARCKSRSCVVSKISVRCKTKASFAICFGLTPVPWGLMD
eukprot:6336866-Lingulodinium_polyedra.AAC.1